MVVWSASLGALFIEAAELDHSDERRLVCPAMRDWQVRAAKSAARGETGACMTPHKRSPSRTTKNVRPLPLPPPGLPGPPATFVFPAGGAKCLVCAAKQMIEHPLCVA